RHVRVRDQIPTVARPRPAAPGLRTPVRHACTVLARTRRNAMSSLDTLISGDLAALGEDSRRSPLAIDDALRTTNMYRDDLPGAQARRDALADERRRELFMMPLAL